MKDHYDLVIVGGGNSAGYVAKELAELNFNGSTAIVCGEPVAPYERPALSKAFLHPPGAKVRARLPGFHTSVGGGGDRQTPEWYAEHKIDLLLSTQATKLDVDGKKLTISGKDGERTVSFEQAILATGSKAMSPADIHMSNPGLDNVFTIREEAEALAMVEALEAQQETVQNLVIVGGGYIGMETAAAFSGWGFQVTMVFPESRLMERLFPEPVSEVFENYFRAKGIALRKQEQVTGMRARDGGDGKRVGAVEIKDGEAIPADAVIFGVGARVNAGLGGDALKRGEGAAKGAYAVDDQMRTSKPYILATGDVVALNGQQHFEHVDFARKTAAQAARVAAKSDKAAGKFEYLPYFYSRLFEYTDTPLIFQFWGDSDTSQGQEVRVFGKRDEAAQCGASDSVPQFGAAWVSPSDNVVRGIMLCNGASPAEYDRMRQIVVDKATFDKISST